VSVVTARLERLLDPGSWARMDDMEPSMHWLGRGTIQNRDVYVYAGIADCGKVDVHACYRTRIEWMASILADPAPVVWLHDYPMQESGGRTPIPAMAEQLLACNSTGVGRAFCMQARLSESVPQISVLFSEAGAAQTFSVRLADFVVMLRKTHAWIGRPDAVRIMLGSTPDAEDLGGAEMHCRISGAGDVLVDDETAALTWVRQCLSLLPQKKGGPLPVSASVSPERSAAEIRDAIPRDLNRPFDMWEVMRGLIDKGSWVGVRELLAPEVMTGFARIGGMPVGVLANNSLHFGGILHPGSCRKMTRFIGFCDRYSVPMLFLCDNPGLMVGVDCEQAGMLDAACELLRILAVARTPRICFVVRKAYTVGLYAMSGPGFDPAGFVAVPGASVSVFGPKALERFAQDRSLSDNAAGAIHEMLQSALNPHRFVEKGYMDAVVEWPEARDALIERISGFY
jgi:methylmalonyl-CoA decarboxylase subunit alpha